MPHPHPEATQQSPLSRVSDFYAYLIPMAIFMGLTFVGSNWVKLYPISYISKTLLVPVVLYLLWNQYTAIKWDYWWLGVIFGIVGVVQWIGMEKLLMSQDWLSWTRMSREIAKEAYNPYEHFSTPAYMWTFIAIRWLGASLVVPFMEELFWRDFLWRSFAAPNDFKLAEVGEFDRTAVLLVPLFFATVHVQWLTAVVWGLLIAILLLKTRSLGACIIMHGVTNFLLGAYVLYTQEWYFW